MYYVYVLKSNKTTSLYIGFTADLKQRIIYHNQGRSIYTKRYAPWKLVYYEAYFSKHDAIVREKKLKKYHNNVGNLKKRISRSLENVG